MNEFNPKEFNPKWFSGYAVSQLPERFQSGPHTETLSAYIDAKYSAHGYKRRQYIEYNPEWTPEDSRDRYRWVENVSKGLRFVGKADKLVKLGHTGWYMDNFQDETVHGQVWQLPARNGEPQFIPGVNDSRNPDASAIDVHSITSDKEDCARTADQMAKNWAEREREYQAKQDAENRLEEIEAEIKDEYQDFRRITREIRANCDAVKGVAVVRELVKEKWQRTKAAIKKLKREAKRIEDHGMEYPS